MRVRLQYQHSTVLERLGVFWTGMANGMAANWPIRKAPSGGVQTPLGAAMGRVPDQPGEYLTMGHFKLGQVCLGFRERLPWDDYPGD